MTEPNDPNDGTFKGRFLRFVAALDRMPPIRLPIGPAIPWRYGLPLFIALVALYVGFMVFGTPARQEPIFAPTPGVGTPATARPIGVNEPASANIDFVDVTMKLLLVLVLAYGSLWLLRRFGYGGTAPVARSNANALRVISHLSLAPNRSVHMVRAPDGRALVIGSTPTQVNLIVDLGVLPEDVEASADGASFFNLLNSKLS